jgi:hypothetical protein
MSVSHNPEHGSGSMRPHRRSMQQGGVTGVSLLDLHSWVVDDVLGYLSELDRKPASTWLGREQEQYAIINAIVLHWSMQGGGLGASQHEQEGRRLAELAAPLDRALVLGEPNAGRTDWLKQFAAVTARESADPLIQCRALPDGICIPVYLRLSAVSEALSNGAALSKILAESNAPNIDPELLTDAQRFGAALLFAIRATHRSYSPRLGQVLWRKLWTDADERPALVILDGWDELTQSQQDRRVTNYLLAFLDQSSARVFIGSRFLSAGSAPSNLFEFLDFFVGQRRGIISLWPYEIWLPAAIPGLAGRIYFSNLGLLEREISKPGYQRRLQRNLRLGINRPLSTRIVVAASGGAAVVAAAVMSGFLLMPKPVPPPPATRLEIVDPKYDDVKCEFADVSVRALQGVIKEVWVFVIPQNGSHWEPLKLARSSDGLWTTKDGRAHFGNKNSGKGERFDITAVANSDPSLSTVVWQGSLPEGLPAATIRVWRSWKC